MKTVEVYIDDSADQKRAKVVVAGGYLGFPDEWTTFRAHWKGRLRREGLQYFRSAEYYSLRGEFARYRDLVQYPKPQGSLAAKALRDDLESIIKASQLVGLAVCIPMDTYNEIRNSEPHGTQVLAADAFRFALQLLMKITVEEVRNAFPTAKLSYICDESPSSANTEQMYAAFKKLNPKLSSRIKRVTHRDDKLFPQLQAGDLIAHLAFEAFTKWVSGDKKFAECQRRMRELRVQRVARCDSNYLLNVMQHERKRRGLG
jgi:hypothetical protein